MNDQPEWESVFQTEIEMAKLARAAGNEGKARVCARRAVGALVGEYFRRQQIPVHTPSAYDRLRYLCNSTELPVETLRLAQHFLARVSPDYTLPIQADLIDEAEQLRRRLLGGG